MACLVFFAFTTILGWDYYGERCLEYFSGGEPKGCFDLPLAVYPGGILRALYDGRGGLEHCRYLQRLMAFPNLIAILALSGVVCKETKDYFKRLKERSDI